MKISKQQVEAISKVIISQNQKLIASSSMAEAAKNTIAAINSALACGVEKSAEELSKEENLGFTLIFTHLGIIQMAAKDFAGAIESFTCANELSGGAMNYNLFSAYRKLSDQQYAKGGLRWPPFVGQDCSKFKI